MTFASRRPASALGLLGGIFMTFQRRPHLRQGLLLLAITVITLMGAEPPRAATRTWVSGYYVGYMSSTYPPSAIDYSALTHVMVFSVVPRSDGSLDTTLFIDASNGPKTAMDVAQRAHAAGASAILTIGGANTEAGFLAGTRTQTLGVFAQNIVNVVNAWGFDGVDIDWEPLPSSDYPAFLSLIKALRNLKPTMTITTAVGWQSINFPMSTADKAFYAEVATLVDQMNMMTYGMADNWGGWVSWHSSALFGEGGNHPSSVSSSAQAYVNAGVPAWKLGLGIGGYGSCWSAPTTAPLQSLSTSRVVAADNSMSFGEIHRLYYSSQTYRYDATAEAPYLSFSAPYGPAGCTFVSYEDEKSVAAKGSWALSVGLGGTIIWQLNESYVPGAPDPQSFLHAVSNAFLGGTAAPSLPSDTSAPAPDTTPPAITFDSPRNNSTVPKKGLVTLSAIAADDTGVAKVEFYVGSSLVCSVPTAPFVCPWRVPAAPNKTYVLEARAYDAANNVGRISERVVSR